MTNSIMTKARLLAFLFVAPEIGLLPACTDLKESPLSSITPENFYKNQDEVLGGLASVYAQLRNIFPGTDGDPGYWALSEVSSDEMVVPTRGSDWADNGRWIELHSQTWTANSPAGLTFINNTWREAFKGVTRANVLLGALPNVAIANKPVIEAELRTLRALYYYKLMDLFGGVPIVTTTEIMPREKNTRQEVFNFIDKELNETRLVLPLTWPADQNGRMTRGAADVILANMYLNAAVFTKENPSATSYNSCMTVQIGGVTACQAAINASDRILNSGAYSLAADQRQNFVYNNHLSPEIILAAKFINDPDLGFHLIQTSLHYNQFGTSPWNGFSLVADKYRTFDPADQRLQAFLVGPQVNVETGQPVTERAPSTARLSFTVDIANQQDARENEGIRFYKWPRDPAHAQQGNGNDFAYFRLAEVYMIKAEAQNEITPGSPQALLLVNQLRARVFTPPKPLAAISRDAILNERLFEFAVEGKRRQDLIRHGKFTAPWQFKPTTTGAFRVLFPIPQTQLDANPKLIQNPGY
jgi:hypothetical protein